MSDKVNLAEKLATFNEHWAPRTVALFNGHDVMIAKFEGAFNWHAHPDTDDFFFVLDGEIDIQLRDRSVHLKAGEMFVVPQGVEHRPVALSEAHVMLIETSGTPNTGDPETAKARQFA